MAEHGTYAKYKIDNCRCLPCRRGASAYRTLRHRLIAYGRWQPFVDVTPVREHIEVLRRAGIGRTRVAELAGLFEKDVYLITIGTIRKIRPERARRILAIRPELENAAPLGRVSAIGSQRRLQALVAVGWSQRSLAARLGLDDRNFARLMRAEQISATTALKVRALYSELWKQQPPAETGPQRCAISRAKNQARAAGWVSPLAWDDSEIDDPNARPRGVRREQVAA